MRSTIILSFLSAVISTGAFGQLAIDVDPAEVTYKSGPVHPESCIKDDTVETFVSGGTSGDNTFFDVIAAFSEFSIATSGFKIFDAATCMQKIPVTLKKGFYISSITAGLNYDIVKGANSTAQIGYSGSFTKNATFLKFVNGSRSFAKGQAVDEQSAFTNTVTFDRNSFLVKLWCAQTSKETMEDVFQSVISLSSMKSTFQSSGDVNASVLNYFVSYVAEPCN